MNIRFNNPYSAYKKQEPTFGTNKGVLRAVERLEKRFCPDGVDDLQVQADDADITDLEFLKQIENIKSENIKFITKRFLGLIPWE